MVAQVRLDAIELLHLLQYRQHHFGCLLARFKELVPNLRQATGNSYVDKEGRILDYHGMEGEDSITR